MEMRGPPLYMELKYIARELGLVSHTSVLHHLNGSCRCRLPSFPGGSSMPRTPFLLYPEAKLHARAWRFVVEGRAKPYVRARTQRGRYYTDPDYNAWRDTVTTLALVCLRGEPRPLLQGPVAVAVMTFVYGHPGDPDNYLKGVMDALQGIFYDDDRRVKRGETVVEKAPSRDSEYSAIWVGELRG